MLLIRRGEEQEWFVLSAEHGRCQYQVLLGRYLRISLRFHWRCSLTGIFVEDCTESRARDGADVDIE